MCVCVCVCVCMCVYVCVCLGGWGGENRRGVIVGQAVCMLRPLSAACQDVASFVR